MKGITRIAGKAANMASDAVGDLINSGVYPESEYGLAAYLFERIAQTERDDETRPRDREYCLDLMRTCLETVRNNSGQA